MDRTVGVFSLRKWHSSRHRNEVREPDMWISKRVPCKKKDKCKALSQGLARR